MSEESSRIRGKRNHKTTAVQQPREELIQIRVGQSLLGKPLREGEMGKMPDVFECIETYATQGEFGVE